MSFRKNQRKYGQYSSPKDYLGRGSQNFGARRDVTVVKRLRSGAASVRLQEASIAGLQATRRLYQAWPLARQLADGGELIRMSNTPSFSTERTDQRSRANKTLEPVDCDIANASD